MVVRPSTERGTLGQALAAASCGMLVVGLLAATPLLPIGPGAVAAGPPVPHSTPSQGSHPARSDAGRPQPAPSRPLESDHAGAEPTRDLRDQHGGSATPPGPTPSPSRAAPGQPNQPNEAAPSVSAPPSPSAERYRRAPAAGDLPPRKPDRPAASSESGQAQPNSEVYSDRVSLRSQQLAQNVARSLIAGGLVGFTISVIAMALVGWLRRRL